MPGVGFRPFVYRTAEALGLSGWVANVNGHVEGEVTGPSGVIEEFASRLRAEASVLARVRRVELARSEGRSARHRGFRVWRSAPSRASAAPREIPPDAAICDACLRELSDPADRRHRYPFINCTDCGPRATIIEDLPYDRVRTTMRRFPLCADCAAEYADPGDRRFHAEPAACPACGPQPAWDELRGEEALRAAVKTVADGGIIALKGLGGYQLVCDAGDPMAVAELRRRKRRPMKPFAVMVPDIEAAARLARISGTERDTLTSPARPVVLLAARPVRGESPIADEVHPGLPRIGLFLPTTGLHRLLLDDLARPLMVTSGNVSDAPISIDDAEARRALSAVTDGFLTHDRPIRARPLPGGDAAVRHPSRTVLGRLLGSEPLGTPRPYPWLTRPFTDRLDPAEVAAVRAMVARDVNCPRASSAGRLFDTVASLLGLVDTVGYEGEAAVLLEAAAGTEHAVPFAHRIVRANGLWVYDPAPTLTDLLVRQSSGEPVPRLASAFHPTLALVTAELFARAVADGAPRTVCLGGGCFVNRRLLTEVRPRLRAQGLRVLVGGQVPVGDGGISYGQAAVAAARLAQER
ncbi:Sua5/YciO/YrdC/YwlC family protein [Streptomyces sp. NPDC050704]|uniref:Kae1-like domain-containing protein n=1 Tax=Streptomyces sp. NPDC050704 TaxID=3157219 RepID=UPI00341A952E